MVTIVHTVVFIANLFLGVFSSLEIRFHFKYILYPSAQFIFQSSTMTASGTLPC